MNQGRLIQQETLERDTKMQCTTNTGWKISQKAIKLRKKI